MSAAVAAAVCLFGRKSFFLLTRDLSTGAILLAELTCEANGGFSAKRMLLQSNFHVKEEKSNSVDLALACEK